MPDETSEFEYASPPNKPPNTRLVFGPAGGPLVPVSDADPLPITGIDTGDITIGTVGQGAAGSIEDPWPTTLAWFNGAEQVVVSPDNPLPVALAYGVVQGEGTQNPGSPWLVAVTAVGSDAIVKVGDADNMAVRVNMVAGAAGSNSAAGPLDSSPPDDASYTGINVGGFLVGWGGAYLGSTGNAGYVSLAGIGGADISANSGFVDSGTQRVVIATDQPAFPVNAAAAISGGCSTYRVLWPANSTGVSVKTGTNGQVYGWSVYNTSGSYRYMKLYDRGDAPTTGTHTPAQTIAIAGGSAHSHAIPAGAVFANGIGIAVTTGVLDSDTAAPGANEVIINLYYA